ncbi:MAG TPA: hypothetical protein VGK32_16015 [Vicinamibacterales bacterium]|jgi:hypothetical protein
MKRVAAIFVLALLSGATMRAQIVDRVLAVVAGQVITLSDTRAVQTFGLLRPVAAQQGPPDLLVYLVNRQLMLMEVDRYSAPDPEPAQVDRVVASIRARFSTDAEYQQALNRTAMTDGRLRATVADNLRIELYLDQRFSAAAQPTPDEMQRYYQVHRAEFTKGGRLLTFDDVQQLVQEQVAMARRTTLVADWLDQLRRRADVTTMPGLGR